MNEEEEKSLVSFLNSFRCLIGFFRGNPNLGKIKTSLLLLFNYDSTFPSLQRFFRPTKFQNTFFFSIKKPPSQHNRVKGHASQNAYYHCFMLPNPKASGQSHRQSTPHHRVHTSPHAFSFLRPYK